MIQALDHAQVAYLLGIAPGSLEALVASGVLPRTAPDRYDGVAVVHAYIAHLRGSAPGSAALTQQEIAAHLDISDRRLRELLSEWHLDHQQTPLAELRRLYIRKLREEAAGRAAEGDLNLATERAKLAREQRERIAMQNAQTRKELAPSFLLEDILSRAAARACPLLDTIPGEIRRRVPGVDADALAVIAGIVAKARNTIAGLSLADLEAAVDDDAAGADEAAIQAAASGEDE